MNTDSFLNDRNKDSEFSSHIVSIYLGKKCCKECLSPIWKGKFQLE